MSLRSLNLFCVALLSVVGLLCVGARAQAHTLMEMPKARDQVTGYKPPPRINEGQTGFVLPCGVARAASQPVTTFTAGKTIAMKWTETIAHPGCFIIDFAKDDTGPNTTFVRLQIAPHAPGEIDDTAYQAQVTLPNQPCTNCILRIRQYMQLPCPPVPLMDLDVNLYYSCANIVLQKGSVVPDAGLTDGASEQDAAVEMPASSGAGGAFGGSGGAVGSGGAATSDGASDSGGAVGSGGKATNSSGGCVIIGSSSASGVSIVVAFAVIFLALSRRRTNAAILKFTRCTARVAESERRKTASN